MSYVTCGEGVAWVEDDDGCGYGTCRRRSPRGGDFPVTRRDDWCIEFVDHKEVRDE